jgi:hypothetical protein
MWRVEPICEVLTKNYGVSVSASSYHAFGHRGKSSRQIEDERLSAQIEAVYEANYHHIKPYAMRGESAEQ